MTLVEEWKSLARDIPSTGLRIFDTANAPVTLKGFADEKVLGLMLLARTVPNVTRTVPNVKGALAPVEARCIVEARTITRCCFENLYWVVGLAEEGDAFVRKMRDDEMSPRARRF